MPNTVRLHRVLATTPEKIYRAFLEADAVAKWLPPNGFACTVHHLEARVGGSHKMSFRNFTTGNGHVSVALPESFNGEIDASTGHGDFRSDFPIRISGRLSPSRVRGTIGTGGRMIRMVSGNGAAARMSGMPCSNSGKIKLENP